MQISPMNNISSYQKHKTSQPSTMNGPGRYGQQHQSSRDQKHQPPQRYAPYPAPQQNHRNAPPRAPYDQRPKPPLEQKPPSQASSSSNAMTNNFRSPQTQRKIPKRNFDTIKDALEVVQLVPASHYTLLKEESQSYERIMKIGQGTFGEVFKCRCKSTGKLVAIKRIMMEAEREGFPITALREIKMLKLMRHVNVTELVDICVSTNNDGKDKKPQFFLVFAFCDHDLAGILNRRELKLEAVVVKTMLKHMFEGLSYIHGCKVLHRDMKTANILLSKDGYLKLADFGLARPMVQDKCYTNRVVTMWYRPPELLLGERNYDAKIDVWGAGCIMIEFWIRAPIFQGSNDINQLELIMKLCGPITTETVPKAESLPNFKNSVIDPNKYKRSIPEKLGKMVTHRTALDLIDQCLCLDPDRRPSASEALEHPYFHSEPFPMRNVANFAASLKTSFFEYTINRGPKAKPAGGIPLPKQNRPNQKPANQFFDRIY